MRGAASLVVFVGLASSLAFAQPADIPLRNWTVPPYHASGVTTMADQTPPRVFIGLQPCRLLDTRNNLNPLGGGGPFATNQIRTYTLPGNCGIPSGTDAVSLNITVTNTVPNPFGHIKVWPSDQAEPNVSTLNWSAGSVTESNAAIVPLSVTPAGQLNVKSGNAGCDVIMDVNGYFSDTLGSPGNFLELTNNSAFYTFFGWNQAPSCPGACGIYMQTDSTAGNVAILGAAVGATGQNVGVEGFSVSTTGGSAGVHGVSVAITGKRYGVVGEIDGSMNSILDSAGVLGRDRLEPVVQAQPVHPAGVRGESTFEYGVLGLSNSYVGVGGLLNDLLGNIQQEGRLASGDYGVYAFGDIGATGTKFFVEPHPTDASKVIRYVALEGNEPGTYFRGRGRFRNGIATIEVPEDFRMVTGEEGLTVQVTPIGGLASVGVLRVGLDEIVVQSSADLEFSYTVNGIRRTHKDGFNPIAENVFEYVPRSPDERMPAYLTEAQKELLIQNGTYRPDGTVNMETAQRLGWDRKWKARARPAPEPAP